MRPRAKEQLGRASRALLAALLFAACSGPSEANAKPEAAQLRIPVTIETDRGPVVFQAEIADSPAERQQGLMNRTQLAQGEGMLFLFPREEQLSFWMRNTLIPLDMIFIRSDLTVLGVVENAAPKTDTPRSVPGHSQYVLELRGGEAAKSGVRAGQKVRFLAPSAAE